MIFIYIFENFMKEGMISECKYSKQIAVYICTIRLNNLHHVQM